MIMPMDATVQIRMDSQLKADVEGLYRSLGTSFTEAVRIFAQQSLIAGGMPFRPALKKWEDMQAPEIEAKLANSFDDVKNERIIGQDKLDNFVREKIINAQKV